MPHCGWMIKYGIEALVYIAVSKKANSYQHRPLNNFCSWDIIVTVKLDFLMSSLYYVKGNSLENDCRIKKLHLTITLDMLWYLTLLKNPDIFKTLF